jgi:hypothetical protein
MAAIVDLYYLPVLEFFVSIADVDELILDDLSFYQKQTFRNRTSIQLANKTEVLSVPVLGGNQKIKYREIEIDHHQKWLNVHLRGIKSAYGKAPFFEFYYPYIEEIFDRKMTHLWELNVSLLTVCLKLLKWNKKILLLSEISNEGELEELRGIIHAKQDFSARNIYEPHPYPQLFGVDFVPNLSIIDLLFCSGPESSKILSHSKKNS